MPRFRFTIRRMMVAVAIAGVACFVVRLAFPILDVFVWLAWEEPYAAAQIALVGGGLITIVGIHTYGLREDAKLGDRLSKQRIDFRDLRK